MIIYIEHAIIDNMIINSILLWCVFRTIKQATPRWRVFFSALVGTGFALVLPLFMFQGALSFFIRLFVGALMVFIVQNKSLPRFTLFYLLFLTYTFALGGMMLAFISMTGLEISHGVVAGTVLAFFLLMKLLIKFLNVRHSLSNHLHDVVIHHKGEQFKITSYLDTGNRLTDNGTPVVIISLSLFLKIFPDISPDRILLEKLEAEVDGGRYVPLSTIAGQSKIFTFSPQKLEIIKGKTHENVRLGVSMRGFKDAVRYDALLNANLI